MNNNTTRPNWLVLYLLVGVFLLVFFLEIKRPYSRTSHIWAEIGLVLLLYGLVVWWLKANEAALMKEDWEKSKPRSVSQYAGWSIPAWLSAIWSHLVAIFHRLP